MFENIGLWVYLFTRLDSIRGLFFALTFLSIMCVIFLVLFQLIEMNTFKWKPVALVSVCAILFTTLNVLTPSKEDAMLIAGVTVGVDVAKKTVESVSNSELIGNVMQIVEMKVESTLKDMKKEANK